MLISITNQQYGKLNAVAHKDAHIKANQIKIGYPYDSCTKVSVGAQHKYYSWESNSNFLTNNDAMFIKYSNSVFKVLKLFLIATYILGIKFSSGIDADEISDDHEFLEVNDIPCGSDSPNNNSTLTLDPDKQCRVGNFYAKP